MNILLGQFPVKTFKFFIAVATILWLNVALADALDNMLGKPEITVDVENVEVSSLISIIADFTDQNIVVSDGVKGRMSLSMYDKPWDKVLDEIVTERNLKRSMYDDFIIINTRQEYKSNIKYSRLSDDLLDSGNYKKMLNAQNAPIDLLFYCQTHKGNKVEVLRYGDLLGFRYGKFFITDVAMIKQWDALEKLNYSDNLYEFVSQDFAYSINTEGVNFGKKESGNYVFESCDTTKNYFVKTSH